MTSPLRVVFVGQLPPPVHGQAVANGELAAGHYEQIALEVVPMRFSTSIDAVGRLQPAKLLVLPRVVAAGVRASRRHGRDALVYSVGLRGTGAALRDAVVLGALRPWFRRTVLHVHTADVAGVLAGVPAPLCPFVRRAYAGAHVLYTDPSSDVGGTGVPGPASVQYVPCGIADPAAATAATAAGEPTAETAAGTGDRPTVLFLSNLYPSKGTEVLLRAVAEMNGRRRAEGRPSVAVVLAGGAPDEATVERLRTLAAELGLAAEVELPGVVGGDAKDALFRRASLFCFPTFYEAESFGLVVLEAMAYGLPIVASTWRALPNLVTDGVDGLLVEPRDPAALAVALERVLDDPALAAQLGAAARTTFEARFTVERFRAAFESAVVSAVASGTGTPAGATAAP